MGRITNAVGLRLGHKLPWNICGQSTLISEKSIVDYYFIRYIEKIFYQKTVTGKIQDSIGIFGSINISHKKDEVVITIPLYRPDEKRIKRRRRRGGKSIKMVRKRMSFINILNISRPIRTWLKLASEEYYGKRCRVNFVSTTNHSLEARTVVTYIQGKLRQGFSVNEVIYPLMRLVRRYKLFGLRIECAGRFTRRQRASFVRVQVGRVPLSTLEAPVQYATGNLLVKFGQCGIKVWLCGEKRIKYGMTFE